jgi:recombination protein RecT
MSNLANQNENNRALSPSERFTNKVMSEFVANAGDGLVLTDFQKKLIQNYFIKLDQSLKTAEQKRMSKPEAKRDPIAFTWDNVNMQQLALNVITFSAVGLDPVQPNHLNLIPYANKATKKYDIGFIKGYRGLELIAKKYGLEVPDDIIVEVVYSSDIFRQIKRDVNNRIESYQFEIVKPFERGTIIGGFYCNVYFDKPEKNQVVVFDMNDINKRKPKYASTEFWGGEKDKWENNQKVGTETVEGWQDEMVYKTLYRAAYNDITIDSEKIDAHFVAMQQVDRESISTTAAVTNEIKENSNTQEIGFTDHEIIEPEKQTEQTATPIAENNESKDGKITGPGF